MLRHAASCVMIAATAACAAKHSAVKTETAGGEPASVGIVDGDGTTTAEADSGTSPPNEVTDGVTEPPPPRETTETLDIGGQSRSFVLIAPSAVSPGKGYSLILGLHGDGGD